MDSEGYQSGEKKVRVQSKVNNITIDEETSEERQRRLNCERQQRYHKNKRNMDSEGYQSGEKEVRMRSEDSILTSSFLDPSFSIISEDNMTTSIEQEIVTPLATVPQILKARIY